MLCFFAIGGTLSIGGQAQQNTKPLPKSPSRAKVSPAEIVKRAMISLEGKSLYSCITHSTISSEQSYWHDFDPLYYDATDAKGAPIADADIHKYFPTGGSLAGTRLVILAAETEMIPVDGRVPPTVYVSLSVENPANKVSAGVQVEIHASDVTPSRILAGIAGNGGSDIIWYRLRPITFPEIGMSIDDVHCSIGLPDHTNTDALGDDQLVYLDGKLLVYIDHRTNRVTDVQTSF